MKPRIPRSSSAYSARSPRSLRLFFFFSFVFSSACTSDATEPRVEFLPQMVDSVPFDSFAPNPVTADGKTLIAPAKGTIPRGYTPFHYGTGKEEAERAGRELTNPIAATPEALARGQKVFETICATCHGKGGLGDGPVVPRFPAPPSLVAKNARAMRDGQIFHVITRGQGLMVSHAAQVSPDDRWRIVHHVRALQRGGDRRSGAGTGSGTGADGGAK